MENNFRAVCVNALWVPMAFSIIEKSSVRLCCVVGFPLGASFTKIKVMEAQLAIEAGADEIDMVIPIGKLKEHDVEYVYNDILAVVQTASKQNSRRGNKVLVKVILEICLLSEREIIDGAIVSELAGAHFVKTSTGFSTGGATVEAVKIIKSVVGNRALVKASGGVRTLEAARMYIEAGVSRIGTSSGITIVNEAKGCTVTDTPPLCNDSSQGNRAAY
jgi:deoxyribose-phosphate aldolase